MGMIGIYVLRYNLTPLNALFKVLGLYMYRLKTCLIAMLWENVSRKK